MKQEATGTEPDGVSKPALSEPTTEQTLADERAQMRAARRESLDSQNTAAGKCLDPAANAQIGNSTSAGVLPNTGAISELGGPERPTDNAAAAVGDATAVAGSAEADSVQVVSAEIELASAVSSIAATETVKAAAAAAAGVDSTGSATGEDAPNGNLRPSIFSIVAVT